MFSLYLSLLGLGFLLGLIWLSLSRIIALKTGYLDQPGERKSQTKPIPYGGGIGIFLSLGTMCLLIALAVTFEWLHEDLTPYKLSWEVLLQRPEVLAIAFGGFFTFFLGVFDDLKSYSAKTKLVLQILCYTLVVYFGPKMSFFSDSMIIGLLGTVLWIVFITNAFNLIDNMDGLCASVVIIALGTHFILLHQNGNYLIAFLTILLASPVIAFLFFNAPPAKLYLGDSGSLLLGYAVSQLSILSTYWKPEQPYSSLFIPLVILAIPIYDVLTVLAIRFRRGLPIFKGDQNHFSHRLLALGLNKTQALLTIASLCCAVGIGGVLLNTSQSIAESFMIFTQIILVFLVILTLERAGMKQAQLKQKQKN